MPHINTNKMTNKGSKIPVFPKWSNILVLKMCFSGSSFCALLWHSILFPKDAKYWMPRIIPFNKCARSFYHIQAASSVFVDMKDHQMVQSAVRSGRTDVRFYPLHGRKWSLTDWQGEFFANTMTWITKVFVVALNDCTNSTSSFRKVPESLQLCLQLSP